MATLKDFKPRRTNIMADKSKLYLLNHSILPTIQNGIQAGHAAVELVLKYKGYLNPDATPENAKLVNKWAYEGKVFRVLNGGLTSDLMKLRNKIKKLNLPWAQFREPDFGNMVTSIAVLIPEEFPRGPIQDYGLDWTFNRILKNLPVAK